MNSAVYMVPTKGMTAEELRLVAPSFGDFVAQFGRQYSQEPCVCPSFKYRLPAVSRDGQFDLGMAALILGYSAEAANRAGTIKRVRKLDLRFDALEVTRAVGGFQSP